ncbi:MAG TPA: hypothetical protein TECP_00998 [Hyphomicrobiaceae bacterium MAG_BT-2024]
MILSVACAGAASSRSKSGPMQLINWLSLLRLILLHMLGPSTSTQNILLTNRTRTALLGSQSGQDEFAAKDFLQNQLRYFCHQPQQTYICGY